MALYAIGELHLGLSVNKPMDIFGSSWTTMFSACRTPFQN